MAGTIVTLPNGWHEHRCDCGETWLCNYTDCPREPECERCKHEAMAEWLQKRMSERRVQA